MQIREPAFWQFSEGDGLVATGWYYVARFSLFHEDAPKSELATSNRGASAKDPTSSANGPVELPHAGLAFYPAFN